MRPSAAALAVTQDKKYSPGTRNQCMHHAPPQSSNKLLRGARHRARGCAPCQMG